MTKVSPNPSWMNPVKSSLMDYIFEAKRFLVWSGDSTDIIRKRIEDAVKTALLKYYGVKHLSDIPEEEIGYAKFYAVQVGRNYIDANIKSWWKNGHGGYLRRDAYNRRMEERNNA